MKYLLTFGILLFSIISFSQEAEKTVTITVSGSGKTQEEAKQSALRSAIEQAFGTFISSKTEILNDKLISDEITSISNGNIKSFDMLNEIQLSDNVWRVNIRVVVSVNKLKNFVQSKGYKVEINGGLFALNIKQQMFNENSEIKLIYELTSFLIDKFQKSVDYKISSNEPKSIDNKNQMFKLTTEVKAFSNDNFEVCSDYLISTLKSICLSAHEIDDYNNLNKPIFNIQVNYKNNLHSFSLRNENSFKFLKLIATFWKVYNSQFSVKNGSDFYSSVSLFEKNGFKYKFADFSSLNGNNLTFNLKSKNEELASFNWSDNFTLSTIENMTEFVVKPENYIDLKIKNGGIVINEQNDHGLVLFPFSIGLVTEFSESIEMSDSFKFLNYEDWKIPNIDELETVVNFINSNKFLFTLDMTFNDKIKPVESFNERMERLKNATHSELKEEFSLRHINSQFWSSSECNQDGSKIRKKQISDCVFVYDENNFKKCVPKSKDSYRYINLLQAKEYNFLVLAIRNY